MLCNVFWLGLIEYSKCYELQKKLWQDRLEEKIPDTILLLEHPPVFTLGKSGSPENILISRERMASQGISLFFTDRGGDVTYHGPGQIVAYTIMDLRNRNRDLHRFVFDLEEVFIRVLKDYSIESHRDESHPGIWVGPTEIAAIGLSVRNWITMHGAALNVNTGPEPFSWINPCGFSDRKATSMALALSRNIPLEEVKLKLVSRFSEVFDMQMAWLSLIKNIT